MPSLVNTTSLTAAGVTRLRSRLPSASFHTRTLLSWLPETSRLSSAANLAKVACAVLAVVKAVLAASVALAAAAAASVLFFFSAAIASPSSFNDFGSNSWTAASAVA